MRPVLISLQILEEVASRQPIGTSELARHLDLSKTTVHRALMSLSEAGWIISESEGEQIGIACGTPFDDAGAVRIGIHESLIV